MQLLHTFTNNLPVTAKPSSKYFLNIPPEIINLLWFADGPMKNYVSNQSNKACESEYFSIFISYKEEPSLIHQSDVIGKVLYPPQNLGYYPSYNQLSANARASYLNWLENIDNEINLSIIANNFFINKNYLSEVFKKKTNMSLLDYITKTKMERGKKLLAEGELRSYEIADKLGYKDAEYFSKLFKKYSGMSPKEYKNLQIATINYKN